MLGLGNVLLGDEGIGVWIAESLQRQYEFPETVTVLDGGTLGLDLLPRLDGVQHLLLIDAVKLGRTPGDIVRLEGSDVPAGLHIKVSPHQVGLQDLLAVARLTGREPSQVVLWGMEPECLEPGTGFSAKVRDALPRLQAEVLDGLRHWGVPARRREVASPGPIWWEQPEVDVPR